MLSQRLEVSRNSTQCSVLAAHWMKGFGLRCWRQPPLRHVNHSGWPSWQGFHIAYLFYCDDNIFLKCVGLIVFSSNTGKYWPEKTPYLNTFHAVKVSPRCIISQNFHETCRSFLSIPQDFLTSRGISFTHLSGRLQDVWWDDHMNYFISFLFYFSLLKS